ncbi:MAG: transposase [Deltaproteobacteria bacterium]|nr:transposase [Deltaproteobacteria bacterium]
MSRSPATPGASKLSALPGLEGLQCCIAQPIELPSSAVFQGTWRGFGGYFRFRQLRATSPRTLKQPDRLRTWVLRLEKAAGHNKAAVALANKMARIIWATWKRQRGFESVAQAA